MALVTRPIDDIVRDLEGFLQKFSGPQAELARKAGVSQSTISRAMSRRGRKRVSRGLMALCSYARITTMVRIPASVVAPQENAELMRALREVWDGSGENAKVLAKVIRSLKPLVRRGK